MPCQYYAAGEEEEILRKKLNQLTRLLCHATETMVSAGMQGAMTAEHIQWWTGHQEMDRKRQVEERAALERQRQQVEDEIRRLEARVEQLKKANGN